MIVRFKVATESQPDWFMNDCEYIPLVVYVCPFHTNESHPDNVVVEVELKLIIKFKEARLSQPFEFTNV